MTLILIPIFLIGFVIVSTPQSRRAVNRVTKDSPQTPITSPKHEAEQQTLMTEDQLLRKKWSDSTEAEKMRAASIILLRSQGVDTNSGGNKTAYGDTRSGCAAKHALYQREDHEVTLIESKMAAACYARGW